MSLVSKLILLISESNGLPESEDPTHSLYTAPPYIVTFLY